MKKLSEQEKKDLGKINAFISEHKNLFEPFKEQLIRSKIDSLSKTKSKFKDFCNYLDNPENFTKSNEMHYNEELFLKIYNDVDGNNISSMLKQSSRMIDHENFIKFLKFSKNKTDTEAMEIKSFLEKETGIGEGSFSEYFKSYIDLKNFKEIRSKMYFINYFLSKQNEKTKEEFYDSLESETIKKEMKDDLSKWNKSSSKRSISNVTKVNQKILQNEPNNSPSEHICINNINPQLNKFETPIISRKVRLSQDSNDSKTHTNKNKLDTIVEQLKDKGLINIGKINRKSF